MVRAGGFRAQGSGSLALPDRMALALAALTLRPLLLRATRRARAGDRVGARALLLRASERIPAHAALRPMLDLRLARLHQELGAPFEALMAARAVLARDPANVAAAEIAIRGAHRLERERDVADLLVDIAAHAGLAQPGDGAAIARLLIACERHEEAAAAAGEATPGAAAWSAQLDAAYAIGDYATAEGAADRLARIAPLKGRHARMLAEIRRARAIVPDPKARFPHALFERVFARSPTSAEGASDIVVLVTSTLANAGAERQLALTARLVAKARAAVPGARTLLMARSLDPARGHAARLPLALTPELEVEDLSRRSIAEVRRALEAGGAPASDLALIAAFPERQAEDILRLYARFRALRPELVHLWQDGTIAVGAVAAVLAGVPHILCAIRNVLPAPGDRRRAAPWLFAMYRALAERPEVRFVANSQAGAADYAAMMGLPPREIAVVHNGVDADEIVAAGESGRAAIRAELGLAAVAPLIGGAFRLARQKRPELWLRTAALVAEELPDARFVILGQGVMRGEMEALADELGLAGRLVFAGARDPVEPWLAALDLFLLCSAQEGLPNALLEAQALGLPAVTTAGGGAPEAIVDGVSGVAVTDASERMLAEAVLALLEDDARREKMGAAAARQVRARFGYARMLAETLGLYAEG